MDRIGVRFVGSAGQTQTLSTTVWCGGCGVRFGAEFHVGLDAEASPERLEAFVRGGYAAINAMVCPACGWTHVACEPLSVHLPSLERLVLVIPETLRHRAEHARAALLVAVADGPGGLLPDYALSPELVVEPAGLAAFLVGASVEADLDDDHETVPPSEVGSSPAPAVSAVSSIDVSVTPELPVSAKPALSAPKAERTPAQTPRLPAVAEPSFEDAFEEVQRTVPSLVEEPSEHSVVESISSIDVVAMESVDLSGPPALPSPVLTPPPLRAPDEHEASIEGRPTVATEGDVLSAVVSGALDAPVLVPEATAGDGEWADIDQAWSLEAVEAPRAPDDEPTHVVRLDEVGPRYAAGPAFDEAAAGETDGYLEVDGDALHAVVRLSVERAVRFENEPVSLRFQLHQPPAGPVTTLLLVLEDNTGTAVDHVTWIFDLNNPVHVRALDMFEQVFAADVVFHDPEGAFHGRRALRAPLEANVRSARAVLDTAEAGDGASAAQILAPDFDLVGRLRHNFSEHAFSDLRTAADARLALGILSYWSAPERREYLLRVRAFPEVWFKRIISRVLKAAVYFGLAMDPHLRQRALELGLASNASELAQMCLSHFAEVNLNLRSSNLDPLDVWENWEALLTLAEEIDLRVSEDIEDVAAQAMERARNAARESELIDLDQDGSVEVEEITDLLDPDDQDLVRMLEAPNRRIEAAMALIQGGSAVNVGPLFAAIQRMSREELLWTVPAALSMGPAFENSFILGLRSQRTSLRLACALALGEIRSERAAVPMLRLIQRARAEEWPVLARAAARIGRRILGPATRVVATRGDEGRRVAHTLALLGTEARGALAAARAQQTDDAVVECLERALADVGRVGFGDPADFTERLSDAFRDAGPDQVGPDFEEALASVDMGPGASISVETDVDLDDLDGSGHG
jgi:hypothetical protein